LTARKTPLREDSMAKTAHGAMILAAAAALWTQSVAAETGADFFKGRTVTYIVSAGAGGGYDAYARLTAEFMQRNLPGSTFVVRNMPGAGHLIGANALYASKPDGLTIGSFSTGLIYNQISRNSKVAFDLTRMSWIGKAASEPRVILIAAQVPVKTFEEFMAQKTPLNFAASGLGSASYLEMMMLSSTLKMPIRILTGYSGSGDQLAMRRGEIAGTIGSRSSVQQFVDNGYGRLIAQIGGTEKDVPQLASFVTDKKALALISLIQSQGDIARLTAGPPGIPADRLNALIETYRRAMNDKELQARAEKFGYPVDPAYGEDVLKIVRAAIDQPEETRTLLVEALKGMKE
jgi:tripartite-type tricarboxylate transporter receptor subunit TctC